MRPRTNRWMQMDEIEEGIEGIESKDLEDETVEGRRWGERVSVYRVFIFHVFLFRLLLYQTFLSLSLSLFWNFKQSLPVYFNNFTPDSVSLVLHKYYSCI